MRNLKTAAWRPSLKYIYVTLLSVAVYNIFTLIVREELKCFIFFIALFHVLCEPTECGFSILPPQ